MTYRIKIQVFDGPFDLLLHLIKINEMDIHDLPLAEVANQYLEYIQLMKDLDLEIAGEFLVMAATLINIKARSLLPPREDESDEEEIDEILSAKELMRQLIEYRKFKELASTLKEREQEFSRIFFRPNIVPILPGIEKSEEAPFREDIQNLFSAFSRILKFIEAKGFHEVSDEQFTVEEKIAYLRSLLNMQQVVDIIEIFKRCVNKSEMIAVFLATLELCRLQEIALKQSGLFEPIHITLRREEPKNNENP
ncbi:segregation/condensation protein A [Candidatus Sumerlaeota bacterium]|nr:segregation/condensation protein A [Candidatus Sumerlaeota bacterium]